MIYQFLDVKYEIPGHRNNYFLCGISKKWLTVGTTTLQDLFLNIIKLGEYKYFFNRVRCGEIRVLEYQDDNIFVREVPFEEFGKYIMLL